MTCGFVSERWIAPFLLLFVFLFISSAAAQDVTEEPGFCVLGELNKPGYECRQSNSRYEQIVITYGTVAEWNNVCHWEEG